jgi:chloramphenicol 3-O-phosphotransferase
MPNLDLPRVILIGGSPTSGKSTVARAIAAQVGFSVIGTDDLGAAARGVTGAAVAPDLFAMRADDYREYYISHSAEELLEHAQRSHRALWPGIESVIREHATWASSAIIEGWALLPDLVAKLDLSGVAAVWIEVPDSVLEARVRANPAFYAGASNPDLMIRQFTRRSVDFGFVLRTQTSALQLPLVRLSGSETPEEASRALLESISGRVVV